MRSFKTRHQLAIEQLVVCRRAFGRLLVENARLERSRAALRGQITKLKKKQHND